jgi:predicted ester cyclase
MRKGHEGVEDIFNENCCFYIPRPYGHIERRFGVEDVKRLNEEYQIAFPSFEFTVHETVQEGDKVAARWTSRAVPSKHLVEPMTQTLVDPIVDETKNEGIAFMRMENGRVQDWFQIQDDLTMLVQLGIEPADLPDAEPPPSSTEADTPLDFEPDTDLKRFVVKLFDRVANEPDAVRRDAATDELVSESVKLTGPDAGTRVDPSQSGLELFKRAHSRHRTAFPRYRYAITDIVEEGNMVAVRWVVQDGYHEGPLDLGPFVLSPTHNNANVHGAAMMEVENGQLVSVWQTTDAVSLLRQLMAEPVEPSAAK